MTDLIEPPIKALDPEDTVFIENMIRMNNESIADLSATSERCREILRDTTTALEKTRRNKAFWERKLARRVKA